MKNTAIAAFFLMLGSISNAALQQFTVESDVALRVKKRWSKTLEEAVALGPGSIISFDESALEGPMRYEDGGSTRMSRSGWFRGVEIISSPDHSSSEIRRLNREDYYISETHLSDLSPVNRRNHNSSRNGSSSKKGFKTIKINMLITLREKTGNYLAKVTDLNAGAVLSVNTGNNVGRMKYRDDSGRIKMSSRAWLQGVSIKSAGNLSRSQIRRYNKKKLYVSVDVTYAEDEDGSVQRPPNNGKHPRRGRGEFGCERQFISKGVPSAGLRVAIAGFKRYRRRLGNRRWLALADYTKNSRQKRFFLMNLKTCAVYKEYLSHGSGKQNGVHRGDPNHDGMLDKCKHKGRTLNMTRPGYQIIRGWHQSQKKWPRLSSSGKGLKLHGLQSFNEEVFRRYVVMHESGSVKNYSRVQGRSFGCPMFAKGRLKRLLTKITGGELNRGTFFLQYATQCERYY